jgi:polyisoprenyl-teichoic acid--peptidoglycan teichoic acid transferase
MAKAKKPQRRQSPKIQPPRYSSYSPKSETAALAYENGTEAELKTKPTWRKVVLRSFIFLLILLLTGALIIGIWDERNISSATQKLFGSGNLFSLINSGELQTDDNGRVNVLIAGYSADDPGHAGATLTDSIILLSMNPTKHTGYMLSIPRDLYVPIPGNGHAKINEAYKDGGMGLLTQTVQNIFDVQIGYYGLVGYTATRGVVNALGGIDVTINSPDGRLYDPNRDYTTHGPLVDLTNGMHHLDGEQALNLTRARGDPSANGISIGFEQSDFQRTADQRLVFSAIKSKLNWKLVLDPRKNSQILSAVADNVKTDVPIGEARPLFGLFNAIPNSRLQSLNLRNLNGKNYLMSSFYEGDTLTPAAGFDDFSQINSTLAQIDQQ